MNEVAKPDLAAEIRRTRLSELEPLKQMIEADEIAHSDAVVAMSNGRAHIERLQRELEGWERYVELHGKVATGLEARIKANRDMIRAREDYESASR